MVAIGTKRPAVSQSTRAAKKARAMEKENDRPVLEENADVEPEPVEEEEPEHPSTHHEDTKEQTTSEALEGEGEAASPPDEKDETERDDHHTIVEPKIPEALARDQSSPAPAPLAPSSAMLQKKAPFARRPPVPKVVPLKEGLGCIEDRYFGRLTRVSVAKLDGVVPEDDAVVERMERLMKMPGAFPTAINLCKADTSKLTGKVTKYIMTQKTPQSPCKYATFFLIGMLTHDALELERTQYTKHVCIAPFANGFARAQAVIRYLFNAPYFLLSSYKGGLTFSTNKFEPENKFGGGAQADVPEDEVEDKNSMRRGRTGRMKPQLNRTADVPIYEGRYGPVRWSAYDKLEPYQYDGPIEVGSICAVLFTIGQYATSPGNRLVSYDQTVIKHTVTLNLQALIVLESPSQDLKSWAVGTQHELDYTGIARERGLTLEKAANVQVDMTYPEPEIDPDEDEA